MLLTNGLHRDIISGKKSKPKLSLKYGLIIEDITFSTLWLFCPESKAREVCISKPQRYKNTLRVVVYSQEILTSHHISFKSK